MHSMSPKAEKVLAIICLVALAAFMLAIAANELL